MAEQNIKLINKQNFELYESGLAHLGKWVDFVRPAGSPKSAKNLTKNLIILTY